MATSTNYTSMAYVLETEEGKAPDTPTFQLLPTTGGSPVANITTATSEVIRSDRQTDDLTIVDADISGDINFELSYDPYKDFMEALLQNENANGSISVPSVTADGLDGNVLSVAGIDTAVAIGDVFRLTSTLNDTVDGFYTCTDNTTGGEISIEPSLPLPLTAVTDGQITTTDIVENGSDSTPPSYTFRKLVENEGSTYRWYYHGCRINNMNFNFATGSILNGTFGVIGRTEDPRLTILTGETGDTPIPPYRIMNSVSSVGHIYIGGITLGTCSFSSLDLTIDNQTEAAKSVGTLGACATTSYSLQITGNVEVYFKDLTMYDKFKAASDFSITILLNDLVDDTDNTVLGNGIGINMQKCKFETLDTPISGKDAFLMQSGTFRSLRDITNDNMIKFSFIDAAV